jgi:hypothetical protein
MPPEQDHYDVLGLRRDATGAEIKRRYRLLMREAHPDANAGDTSATRRAARINLAFETLGDAGRRRAYDEAMAGSLRTNGKRADRVYAYWAEHEDWEDIVAAHVKPPRPPHAHDAEPLIEPEEIEVDMSQLAVSARVRRSIRVTNRCACAMKGDVSTSEPWVWGPIGTFQLAPHASVEFDIEVVARKVRFPGLSRVTFVTPGWTGVVPVKITGFQTKQRRPAPATDARYVRYGRRKAVRR